MWVHFSGVSSASGGFSSDSPLVTHTFYYQNIKGLRTKVRDFANGVRALNCEFILVTETWLNSGISSVELFGSGVYEVFRHDRDYDTLTCDRGGGALIAVSSKFYCCGLPHANNPAFEDVWLRAKVDNIDFILCCVYFPPNSLPFAYESFVHTLKKYRTRYNNSKFILVGDFNFPAVRWTCEENCLIPENLPNESSEILLENVTYLGLLQVNCHPNALNRYLDLIFVDQLDFVVRKSDFALGKVDPHHPPLEIVLNTAEVPSFDPAAHCSTFYDFHRTDYENLNRFLSDQNWDCLNTGNINVAVINFYDVLLRGIDLYTPVKTIIHDKYPTWYSPECKRVIDLKNKWYRKYQKSGLLSDYIVYSGLRRETKYLIDLSYLLFLTDTEHSISSNPKHFWSYLRRVKEDNSMPKVMKLNDSTYDGPEEITDAFADHFQSCYCVHEDLDINIEPLGNNILSLRSHTFTNSEVLDKLAALDVSKGPGPDGIPPRLLKVCRTFLIHPLKKLFQLSLDTGVFPDIWKLSAVIPVYKSGDKSCIQNYRGISILSAIPKLFESIITDEVFNTYQDLISPHQHGFYKGRSTTTNLAAYQHYLSESLEDGCQVDTIYTDVAKAFDSVPHNLLAAKLAAFGVGGSYLRWIVSYLSHRTQYVKIGGYISSSFGVTSGVPQGSHIGPILFILFFNDVCSSFQHCRFLMYADDLKLFTRVSCRSDCLKLQKDLYSLSLWCKNNQLKINVSKCKILRFNRRVSSIDFNYDIDAVPLQCVDQFNDLGVLFDKKLTFIPHIDSIALKGFKMLGFIKRQTYHMNDLKAISLLYCSYVRSILEYNSIIWSPSYQCHIDKLERVQNKFLGYYLFRYGFPYKDVPYLTRLQLVGMSSLQLRRNNACIFFLYKLFNNIINCPELLEYFRIRVPNRPTRLVQFFDVPRHRTNYGLCEIVTRISILYNTYYQHCDLFGSSYSTFRNSVVSG